MDKILHTPTGLDMCFEKELAGVIPGWESEFAKAAPEPAKDPTGSTEKPSLPPTICELLREFSTAMLFTHRTEGRLRGRPMIVLEVENSGRLWFLASIESALIQEITEDRQVHLSFQKDHEAYLSLNGRAALVKDSDRIARLWNEEFNPWFSEGKTDPRVALISVTPHDVEYWLHRHPPASGSWDAKVAYVHGTKPETRPVEDQKNRPRRQGPLLQELRNASRDAKP